jgi:transcriptional regulator with XRE-family HTH domain
MGHDPLKGHWGTRTEKSFLYQIGFQFVTQLEDIMKTEKIGRTELAEKLGVSKGRVSQILNDPGNLTLKTIVRYTRALDRQVSIVAYSHKDTENDGPVHPEIFVACWELADKPTDFSSVSTVVTSRDTEPT